jgi:hypothetical protein
VQQLPPAQPMSTDQWERAWREHWRKTGFTRYELQLSESKAANGERGFLMQPRTLARERVWLNESWLGPNTGFVGTRESSVPRRSVLPASQTGRRRQSIRCFVVYLPLLGNALSHRRGTEMKVKIVGAAGGEVTGSAYFVRAGLSDLLQWFSSLAASKPRVVLTHGKNTPRNLYPHPPFLVSDSACHPS